MLGKKERRVIWSNLTRLVRWEEEHDEVRVFTPSETPGVRSLLVLAVVFCPEFSLEYLRGTINKRLVLARQGLSSD